MLQCILSKLLVFIDLKPNVISHYLKPVAGHPRFAVTTCLWLHPVHLVKHLGRSGSVTNKISHSHVHGGAWY